MPVLENIHVQLSEVLEVRGAPLAELEVWAVLRLTLDTIQDLFLRGAAFKNGMPDYLPTPQSIQCTSSGRILISTTPAGETDRIYWAPELVNNNLATTEDEHGKIYVYALAKTIQYALETDSDFPLQPNCISPFLIHTQLLMEEEDPSRRISLTELSRVCTEHIGTDSSDLSLTSLIVNLHQEVLGSLPEAEILNQVNKDFMEENARMSFSVADDEQHNYIPPDMFRNLNDVNKIYGHRLAYRSKTGSPSGKSSKPNARERWKRAFIQISNKRKQENLNLNNGVSILVQQTAQPSISKVYQELAERRRMVELLRMNIDLGHPDVKVNNKGLKPKTLAELVLLLKNNPTKAEPIISTSDRSLSRSAREKPCRDESCNGVSDDSECSFYSSQKSSANLSNSSTTATFGPEFIINKSLLTVSLDLCSKRKIQDGTTKGVPCNLTVVLLTGQSLNVTCDTNISANTLFHAVAHHIMLQEHYLFGLALKKDGELLYLDGRQRLHKVLASLLPDKCSELNSLVLLLCIKYYLTDINLIKHQATRHLYYLQARQDVLSGRLRCRNESNVALSGLALQAEFGDRNSEDEDYFLPEHYVPERYLQAHGTAETIKVLMKEHTRNTGISTDMAEMQFIQTVCELSEYGYHFHKVLQDKHDLNSEVWLGISSQGVDVFEDREEERRKCQTYSWTDIQKLSFTKKSFNITPKSMSLTGRSVKYMFHTSGIFKSRYLFNMSVGHHQFFVKLKSGANASEIIMEDIDLENGFVRNALAESQTSMETDEEVECNLETSVQDGHHNTSSSWLSSVRNRYIDGLQKINDLGSSRKKYPDFNEVMEKCSPSLTSRFLGRSSSEKRSLPFTSLTKRLAEPKDCELRSPNKKRHSGSAKYFDISTTCVIKPLPLTAYQRKVLSGAVDPAKPVEDDHVLDVLSDGLGFSGDSSKEDGSNVSRHSVVLEKDTETGYGLILTCGNTPDTVITGTYIQSVLTRGDASQIILPGDKVISLNGQNVENKNYLEVAELLQSLSGSAVLGLLRATPSGHPEQVSCSPGTRLQVESLLDQPSPQSRIIIQERDVTMDNFFYNEDDPGPPKPRPRRKKSSQRGDQICHRSDESFSPRQEGTTSVPQRVDDYADCGANELSSLNRRSPQVRSTCTTPLSSKPDAESPEENESTRNLNQQCDDTSSVPVEIANRGLEIPSSWKQDSLFKLIPNAPSAVSASPARKLLYSWNLNRPSASHSSEDYWGSETNSVRDHGEEEQRVKVSDDGDVRVWSSSTIGVSPVMDYIETEGEQRSGISSAEVEDEVERPELDVNNECADSRPAFNEGTEPTPVSKFTVSLTKVDGSFGFRVTERYQFGEDYERGVFVHSLVPDGAAELDGTIEPGDRLVRINGSRTGPLSYQESVALLKKCPNTCKLQFERRRPDDIMIAKWGRRGSRTSLGSLTTATETTQRPSYVRSVSQNNLSPVHLPTLGNQHRDRSLSYTEDAASLPRILNGVVRTSPSPTDFDLSPELPSTFPRKSKSKSPSICEDTLSDDVFQGNSSPDSSSQAAFGAHRLRSESAPLLCVPKSQPNRNCGSPSSLHLGSVPEDHSLDNFHDVFTDVRDADYDQEELIMSGVATKYTLGNNASSHPGLRLSPVNGSFEELTGKSPSERSVDSPNSLTEPERVSPLPNIRKKRAGLLERPEDVFKYLTPNNTFEILLQKTSRGLGLGIFGGSDLERLGPVCQLIRVRKLYPLQPAVESGKICVGDVILQVNGQSTIGLKHTEALEILRVAPVDVRLKIYRPNPAVMPPVSFYIKDVSPNSSFLISPPGSACSTLTRTTKNQTDEDEEYDVCLMKKEGSLGFSIFHHVKSPEDDFHPTGIYVRALIREPAISHGRLAPGDRILKVNGVDISNMCQTEAVSLLRNASESVDLRLSPNTDPLFPLLEDEGSMPVKALRKEAVEMLTNRAKYRENKTSPRRLRQRRNGSDSHSSGDDASEAVSGSPRDTLTVPNVTLTNSNVDAEEDDGSTDVGLGLMRNLRPKSLDGLSFNEKKQLTNVSDRVENDLHFQRQGSVLEPGANDVGTEGAGLLKWRGATLHTSTETTDNRASQNSGAFTVSQLTVYKKDSSVGKGPSPVPVPPQRMHSLPLEDDQMGKRNGHLVGGREHAPQVMKVYIELDRGWHGRLGFSLSDILPGEKPNPLSNYTSPVVRAVHAGSIAHKDGRIRVGDRLVMVNGESMVERPATEVIDVLRKTRGRMRMDFLRVQQEFEIPSQVENGS